MLHFKGEKTAFVYSSCTVRCLFFHFEEKFIGPASLRETGFTRHSCSQVCWLCSHLVSPGTAVHRSVGCAVIWFHQAQLFTGLLVVQSFGFTRHSCSEGCWLCSHLVSPGTAVHRFVGCAVIWFHQAQLFTGLLVVQSLCFPKVLKCQHYSPCSLLIPYSVPWI